MSLIVVGMSFSKHPVTFEMLSGEKYLLLQVPGSGGGFPQLLDAPAQWFPHPVLLEGQLASLQLTCRSPPCRLLRWTVAAKGN